MIRDAAPRRDPGQRRHRRAAVAAPGAHPRGRRGPGARPRDPRLGLDRRVRRRPGSSTRSRISTSTGCATSTRSTSSSRSSRSNRYGGRRSASRAFGSVAGIWYRRRELSRSASSRRARGRSCATSVARSRHDGHCHADRHAGRRDGRRDDRLLPDRVPGIERRARARAARA